jgi:hypothetical protein
MRSFVALGNRGFLDRIAEIDADRAAADALGTGGVIRHCIALASEVLVRTVTDRDVLFGFRVAVGPDLRGRHGSGICNGRSFLFLRELALDGVTTCHAGAHARRARAC